MAAHASAESDDFQKYYSFHWWECGFLDMQNSDFQESCTSIGGRAISEIAKTTIFINWFLSNCESMIFDVSKRSMFNTYYFYG
jgi:hypothetical protein